MEGAQASPLSGVIEASHLVITQGQIPVAPLHMRARTLEHLRERLGLMPELGLLHWAQRLSGNLFALLQRDQAACLRSCNAGGS